MTQTFEVSLECGLYPMLQPTEPEELNQRFMSYEDDGLGLVNNLYRYSNYFYFVINYNIQAYDFSVAANISLDYKILQKFNSNFLHRNWNGLTQFNETNNMTNTQGK